MFKIYFKLLILFVIVILCACGSSVQQGFVIWSEGDHILLDIGSNNGIGVGDKGSVYREIQLTHPASGEDLGRLEEELADASIIAVRKNTATAKLVEDNFHPVPLTIQPGDKAIITEQKGNQTPDFIVQIGSVTFIEPQSQNIEITLQKPTEIHPGEVLSIAMPLRIIKHPVSGEKIALQMKKIADVEVIAVNPNSQASCRITELSGAPEIGDAVVKLSEPSISSWFREIDESSEEMIYQRAYRQALRHYESAEYWRVIKKLQIIETLGLSSRRRIETLNTNFDDTLYLLAASYKHLGMYDKAQNYFERAARQKPNDTKIWLELAYMYLEQNRLQKAAEAYQQLTNLLPDNYQLWIELGNIYSRMGDQAKSNAAHQKATKLKPDNE